jgi:threonine/homoserine/homoserine lactone efflux protein
MPAVFLVLALGGASYTNYYVYMLWSSRAQQLKEIQAKDDFFYPLLDSYLVYVPFYIGIRIH